jgi:RimJ/RimL family protein N-acetyltransferase
VLRFYFQELGYQKATVHIYDFNHASLRLHERLGFQVEGRLRRMGFTEGRHFDWIVMGLTREEFDAHEWSPGVGAEP